MQKVVKTPSTSTRKRRYKTSFKFLTKKQLESVREYKRMLRSESSAGNVTKVVKVSKKVLKLSKIISKSDEQDGKSQPCSMNLKCSKVQSQKMSRKRLI
jgi:hypothetical protein